ncbi:MAG: hypothetical protein KY456_16375, partial [Chloroflexi bacterium]|nr:hypothetical protein [Chloroflexota bacterium]
KVRQRGHVAPQSVLVSLPFRIPSLHLAGAAVCGGPGGGGSAASSGAGGGGTTLVGNPRPFFLRRLPLAFLPHTPGSQVPVDLGPALVLVRLRVFVPLLLLGGGARVVDGPRTEEGHQRARADARSGR